MKRENLLRCDCFDDHDDDFDKHDCEEFIQALSRLERISILDKKIVFTPVRRTTSTTMTIEQEEEEEEEESPMVVVMGKNGGVRRRLMSQVASSSPASMYTGPLVRRILRGIF
eukprot:519696_1